MSVSSRNGVVLTDRYVRSLQPSSRRRSIADSECDNLFVVVHPTNRKMWLWRGRIDDKPEKVTLGLFPNCDTKAARARAREITLERASGRNPAAARREEVKRARLAKIMTCDRAFDIYLEHHCLPRNRSWPQKQRLYQKEISPIIGEMPIYDVRHEHLMPILRAKVRAAPIQCNRLRPLIMHWLKWCSRDGRDLIHLQVNPARDLPKLAREKSRSRVLNDYELSLLLEVLGQSTSIFVEPILFVLHTGCRKSEALEMRWEELHELDLKGNWILAADRSKNRRELVLPLSPVMVEMLKRRQLVRGDSPLVWPTTGKSGMGMTGLSRVLGRMRAAMQALAEKEGKKIEYWTLHDLRRTFITRMHGLRDSHGRRFSHDTIYSVTNHKLYGISGVYNRYDYYEEKGEALEVWANFLETLKIRDYRQLSLQF